MKQNKTRLRRRVFSQTLLVAISLLSLQACVGFRQSGPLNCGHKGGYDCMKELPENSFALLEHLEIQQRHPQFKYLEFDIRETSDEHLVVFHDRSLRRMLPDKGYNSERYDELQSQFANSDLPFLKKKFPYLWNVSDLTLKQLQKLSLEGRVPRPQTSSLYQVPTLDKYLDKLEPTLAKPIVFELKQLISGAGQKKLEDAIIKYTQLVNKRVQSNEENRELINDNPPSDTRYNSFPYQQVSVINLTGLKKNLDNPYAFCKKLKMHGIQVYRGWTHDSLCDFVYSSDRAPKLKSMKGWVKRIAKQVAVKHNVDQVESELDPAHYYEPRLVHLDSNRKRFVYTPISSTKNVLTALKEINEKNLIVFVHGRGRHPVKGEEIMAELAEEHSAAVVMFDWDSWICKNYCAEPIKTISTKRPSGNAREASPALANFLTQLRDFKQENPRLKISLLVHSMGNIVFKEMVERQANKPWLEDPFLENLILNSPDVDRKNHQRWLDTVSIANETFVTMTREDLVLGAVELMLYKPRLGQGFKEDELSCSFSGETHYLDFSGVSNSHRKFGVADTDVREVFQSIIGDHSWRSCAKGVRIALKEFDNSCVIKNE